MWWLGLSPDAATLLQGSGQHDGVAGDAVALADELQLLVDLCLLARRISAYILELAEEISI